MPLFLALTLACASPHAVDGDTLRCRGRESVRLLGIDAPEMPGHCRRGRVCTPGDPLASRVALARLVARGPVICTPVGHDRYRRILARCSTAGVDLSCAMVAGGFAVERYSRLGACPVRRRD